MGPDPEKLKKQEINIEGDDFVMNEIDEQMDVENEQNGYENYVQLNTDDEIAANDETESEYSDSDAEDDNNFTFQSHEIPQEPPSNVPSIISSDAEIQAEVWNAQFPTNTIEITTETSQQITQIMSKINLPNAPAWVNEISTETLVSRLKK